MAKAESTTHDAEAEAYLAKAYELMAKHNIEEAMLPQGGEAGSPGRRYVWFSGRYARERIAGARLIAQAAFGDALRTFRSAREHHDYLGLVSGGVRGKGLYMLLIGFDSDVESYVVLWESIDRQAAASLRRWWKKSTVGLNDPAVPYPQWFLDWLAGQGSDSLESAKVQARRSYMHGYFSGVVRKLESIRVSAVAEVPGAEVALASRALQVKQAADEVPLGSDRLSARNYSASVLDGYRDGLVADVAQRQAKAGEIG